MKMPSSQKIIHATECLAAGTLSFLIQATRELADAGVSQVLVFSRRPDTPLDVENLFDSRVKLVEIDPPSRGLFHYAKALRGALLRELQCDEYTAIHLHSSKAGFVGRLVLVGLRSRPEVYYSPHGLSFLNRRFVFLSLAFHALEWLAARFDCQPVGCSRGEAKLLSGLSKRPAMVLENAVDDDWFHLQRQETELPLVVSVGRVCYQKAPEVFAAMAARFEIAEMKVRFMWIGSGDPAAEAQLRAAGVEVTGWLDPASVRKLMAQASVYVQTSRWEGMPLSVLQALAAGVPCVVSDVVGNRDAVRHGWTGFVFKRFDESLLCLRRLLQDPSLNQRFSLAARGDAWRRFSNASFRARLLALYGLDSQALPRANKGARPLRAVASRESQSHSATAVGQQTPVNPDRAPKGSGYGGATMLRIVND